MFFLNIVGFQRSLDPKEMLLVNKILNKMHHVSRTKSNSIGRKNEIRPHGDALNTGKKARYSGYRSESLDEKGQKDRLTSCDRPPLHCDVCSIPDQPLICGGRSRPDQRAADEGGAVEMPHSPRETLGPGRAGISVPLEADSVG